MEDLATPQSNQGFCNEDYLRDLFCGQCGWGFARGGLKIRANAYRAGGAKNDLPLPYHYHFFHTPISNILYTLFHITLTHSHSLSLSLTHSDSVSLTLTHSLIYSHSLTNSLSLTLSLTYSLTHSHSLSLTLTHSHLLALIWIPECWTTLIGL